MSQTYVIKKCELKDIEVISQYAYRINNMLEHSSNFCPKSLETIEQDLKSSIALNSTYGCWLENRLIGIISCYTDQAKNNTDCSLLIETDVCYDDVAIELFNTVRSQINSDMHYTFFFPKENINCSNFLQKIGAHREVNEYCLLLKHGNENIVPTSLPISELPLEYYAQLEKLHDCIFPGVYISGKDIITDIGNKHFVFSLIDNNTLIAYSVLRLNGGKCATAEIVAVREDYRHKGYGRAVLAHLISIAFKKYCMDCINLIVDGDNENAIRLYLDLGFNIETENCCYTVG
jgi:GNAT superfamily N-acetyltransferase